ncbi:DDE superfamily endonuclease [Hirsutella rhossiliensis]
MFWGGFSFNRRTSLTPMLGDPDSARGGVTARRVLETLQESLPTIAEPGYTFAQDNASTHTAAIVQAWLGCWVEENRVDLVDWPPYSPDLNPIENVWKLLKESIMETHPELSDLPKNYSSKQKLCFAAVGAWEDLEEDTLNHLIESMPRRLQAVVAARGWYTKY